MTGEINQIVKKVGNYIEDDFDVNTFPFAVQAMKKIYDIFSSISDYGASDNVDNGTDKIKDNVVHLFDYNGEIPFHAATEAAIRYMLRNHSEDPSIADKDEVHGVAFNGGVYVNEKYVRAALDSGRADHSMNVNKLKYILENGDFKKKKYPLEVKQLGAVAFHEIDHIEHNSNEKGANGRVEREIGQTVYELDLLAA